MQTIKLKKVENVKTVYEIVSIDNHSFKSPKRKIFVELLDNGLKNRIHWLYYGKDWTTCVSYEKQNYGRYYIFIYDTFRYSFNLETPNYELEFEDEKQKEIIEVNKLFPLKVGSFYKTNKGHKVRITTDCKNDYKEFRYIGVVSNPSDSPVIYTFTENGQFETTELKIVSRWKDNAKVWVVLYTVSNVHQEPTLASMLCNNEAEAKKYENKFKQKGTFVKTECITIKGD